MRFYCEGPNIPDQLLERRDQGRVVFLCGAGVSIGAGMPSFVDLTTHVMDCFDPAVESTLYNDFLPWRISANDDAAPKIPLDQIFQQLYQQYPRNEINAVIAERLNTNNKHESQNHNILKRLSTNQDGLPQIVTTNFDRLFELDEDKDTLKIYEPPAFPDIHLGVSLSGITYLHGRLQEPDAANHPYILSSADLGRAYLAEGWATQFIRSLLKSYTVVMVGYSAEDPPVKYLLQGLNHDEKSDRSKLYAFDMGEPEDVEAKWRDRGVTPIAFSDFDELWRSLAAWADRADDLKAWRTKILTLAKQSPRTLTPSERGQVCHLVSSATGAKLFNGAALSAEWLCVFDADYRTTAKESISRGESRFNPYDAYHIDSDTPSKENDANTQKAVNIFRWLPSDKPLPPAAGLINIALPRNDHVSKRLNSLLQWITQKINDPITVWWLFHQKSLHPALLERLIQAVQRNKNNLPSNSLHAWNLLLYYHEKQNQDVYCSGRAWYDLEYRVAFEGWSVSVLRDLEKVTHPKLNVSSRLKSPPSTCGDDFKLRDLVSLEVEFSTCNLAMFDVPDHALYKVFRILESNLLRAATLWEEIDSLYVYARSLPSCYPSQAHDNSAYDYGETTIFKLFLSLFKRLIKTHPKLARAHAETWPIKCRYYFCKLKLFALNQPKLFDTSYALKQALELKQEWSLLQKNRKEFLFLIQDRWQNASCEQRSAVIAIYLIDIPKNQVFFGCQCAKWLQNNGCNLSTEQQQLLNDLIQKIPDWNNSWVDNIIQESYPWIGIVHQNTNPDDLSKLPIYQIADAALAATRNDYRNCIDYRPFKGLVQQHPRKALASLSFKARTDEYPVQLWSELINEWPEDMPSKWSKLHRAFIHRLKRLPKESIQKLAHETGRWIQYQLSNAYALDSALALDIYDHLLGGLQSGGGVAAISAICDMPANTGQPSSRKTYFHAINGPIGEATIGLLQTLNTHQIKGQGIPEQFKSRLNDLLRSQGEGLDHVVSILCKQINWLYTVDPDWIATTIFPWFEYTHPLSEAAWNGLMHSGCTKSLPTALICLICSDIDKLIPHCYKWHSDEDLTKAATKFTIELSVATANNVSTLSHQQARTCLRNMTDQNRLDAIYTLIAIGENEENWRYILSFINTVWPREKLFRTSNLSNAWLRFLDNTGDAYVEAYKVVKPFLKPSTGIQLYNFIDFYRYGDAKDDTLISKYPDTVLDMLDTITGNSIEMLPHNIENVLSQISNANADLEKDRRYQRLSALAQQA